MMIKVSPLPKPCVNWGLKYKTRVFHLTGGNTPGVSKKSWIPPCCVKDEKMNMEVGMKQRIVILGIALLMLLVSLTGCIDKSKWRAKDVGGPPDWQTERPDYGA